MIAQSLPRRALGRSVGIGGETVAERRQLGHAAASLCIGKVIERHTPRKELAFNHAYRKPEWARKDVLGKPDAVPSAGRRLLDLRNYQMTVFAEIIRGDREVAYFDTFVREWLQRGGSQMTREATRLLETKKRVYRSVGASGQANSGKALTGGQQ